MSSITSQQTAMEASSSKMLKAMVGIGTLCALLIVLTYEGTAKRIALLQDQALEAAIFKVLPGTEKVGTMVITAEGELVDEGAGNRIYPGYNNGGFIGVAIEASGQGYAGPIRILYGYDPFKEVVVGFYVLQSNETPGLGDKIEKDPVFLANFHALDVSLNASGQLKNKVLAVKTGTKANDWEVDAITGATISSRAIADIIDESAQKVLPTIQKELKTLEKAMK